MPPQRRRSLDEIYGGADPGPGPAPVQSPSGRRSLEDIYTGMEAVSDRGRTWGDWVGGLVRGAAGFLPGGPIGAAGAGGAELIGQGAEWLSGSRDDFNLWQVPTQAGLGAIPFRGAATLLKSGLKGSALSAGGGATTALVEGVHEMNQEPEVGRERPTWGDVWGNVASQAKFGGLLGFAGGAGAHKLGQWLSGRKPPAGGEAGPLAPGRPPDPHAPYEPADRLPAGFGIDKDTGAVVQTGARVNAPTPGPRRSLEEIYSDGGRGMAREAAGYRGPGVGGPMPREPYLGPEGALGGRSAAEIALGTVDRSPADTLEDWLRGVQAEGGSYGIRRGGDLPPMTGPQTDRITMFDEPLEGAPLRRPVPRDRPTPAPGGSEPPIVPRRLVEPPSSPTGTSGTAADVLRGYLDEPVPTAGRAGALASAPSETAFSRLAPAERRELQLMIDEMESMPYQPREWKFHEGGEIRTAANTDLAELGIDYKPFWEAQAGAPVYQDVLQQGTTRSSRQAVLDAMRRIATGGRSTAIGDRALAVLRQRLQGMDDAAVAERHRHVRMPGDPAPEAPPTVDWGRRAEGGLDPDAGAEVGQALPKPRVPAEIMSAWLDLKPRWAQTVAQQAGDDIPFTVDPAEDLVEFSERVLREPDPRALMGRERAARKAFDARAAAAPPARPSLDELDPELPAPQALSNRDVQDFATGVQQELGPGLKNFDLYVDDQGRIGLWYLATEQGQGVGTKAMQRLTDFADQQGKPITLTPNEADAGVGTTSRARLVDFYRRFGFEEQPDGSMLRPPLPAPGDAGYISPDLLYALGLTGAGAAAGPLLSDSPAVGAIGGGLTGMLLAAARRNPRILSALSYSNILSGQAVPTSIAGNIGGAAAYAAEHPGAAGDVARHMLSPRLVADIKEGFGDRRLTATGRYQLDDETPNALTYASRALGSPDYATRSALQRAGATEREAGQYTLSGDPSSGVGNAIVNLARYPAVQWFMPVAKTAVNVAERGLERTPGLGSLDAVRGWSNASPELARRRQVLGALAMLGGAGVGYESGEGGSLDALPDWLSRYFGALTGPFALPTIAASAAGERFREASDQRDRYPALEALEAMATTGVRQLPLPAPWANPFDPAEFLRRMVPYGGAGRVLSPVPPREFDTSGDPLFGPALSQVPFLNEQLFERRGRPRR